MWAVACLVLPGVLAWRVPLAQDGRPSYLWLKRLVWYHAALLASIQVAASLELAGLIDKFSLPAVAVVAALLIGIVVLCARPVGKGLDAPAHPTQSPLPSYLRFAVAAVAVVYVAGVVGRLVTFPASVDGNSYHLPGIVAWLQDGSLRLPSPPDWRFSLPANGNAVVVPWLALRPLSLTILPNVAAAALAALACFCASERISGSRDAGLAAALVFLTIPIVLFQTLANYIDLFCAAFLLAGLALILRTAGTETDWSDRRSDVLTAALAVGIAAGSKTTALIYAAPLVAALLTAELQARGGSIRAASRPAVLILLALAAPCAFWFARATIETGNPLYPLRPPAALGLDLPGFSPSKITPVDYEDKFVRSPWEWWIHPWREHRRLNVVQVPYAVDFGLGGAFAALGITGWLFSMVRSGRSLSARIRRRGAVDWRLTILSAAVVAYLAVWALAMHRVPRFALPVLGLMSILSAPLVERFASRDSRAFPWLFGGAVSATLGICFLRIGLGAIAAVQFGAPPSHAGFYGLPPAIATLPAEARLINLGPRGLNFALLGPDLSRRVYCPMPNLTDEETHMWLDAVLPRADLVLTADGSALDELVTSRMGPPRRSYPPSPHRNITWNLWRLRDDALEPAPATPMP